MSAPTASPRPDIAHEADIQTLVDRFYDKVNQDELLGPIFNAVAAVHWPAHLLTMYDFWSSVLFGTSRYKGRPFPKHLALPINGPHFQRWLQLFYATVDENFAGPKAEEAKAKALNIATMFEYRMRPKATLSIL
ncbi:group III truncated hemoglobin [Hymenobacter busanensis]|uniref:Group III truncated hemoglobin n=1 Tax=Hymenobacter busanensis TaxID=2607656 RepID=A0A7L4ZRX0_9BACT|nr:group III truncated hemoglobin [Hymenobacter busanensis]KAA9327696.1 group III truncated hemoglobin [Hymenobacter busanensis]QHJ05964.1 sec-independent protein translocase TatC [Hymenobacter busanensis]